MATHSSVLAWEIPLTEEPGRLQSMGLQKRWTGLSNKQKQQYTYTCVCVYIYTHTYTYTHTWHIYQAV